MHRKIAQYGEALDGTQRFLVDLSALSSKASQPHCAGSERLRVHNVRGLVAEGQLNSPEAFCHRGFRMVLRERRQLNTYIV